ncbi:hypothetical protein UY286_08760 [Paenibacillus polymyxa]|uniref:hypothetical protein n=1 Tax=Paenibacillus polymyxa TaxID=1406 RepID=UPI002AB53647|nr:hypothetical protein [Paenibacillus polymyxa]MDY7990661.1 hypothetical protein [Paenibacillus polymyxa]MDY8117529.1 hypothetical protein [Paenibacillus polymyxa]
MAWIESHQGTDRHPKTRKLCRKLGISTPAAVGHLHMFWWWAMDFAQDGDISRYGPDDIADAIEWDGDSVQLYTALVEAGFIDETEAGREIHDWYAYAGRLIERRAADAERKRNSRSGKKSVPPPSIGSPPNVQRTGEGQRAESIRDLNPNPNLNHKEENTSCPEPPPAGQDEQSSSEKGKGKKPDKYGPDNTYYKMAVYFKGKVDEMAQGEGLEHLTARTNLQTWADDFRKLVELDKQSDRDLIKSVIDWVVKDAFWKSNVLSAESFRRQFGKLVLEMRKPDRQSRPAGRSDKQPIDIVKPPEGDADVSQAEVDELMRLAERMESGKGEQR